MNPTTAARPRTTRVHAALLLVVYLLARLDLLHHLDSPIVGWRPADLASIALNYSRNGFHLFHPQILWGGQGPGYVEMEFPIVPFLTGVLFKLFGVHDLLDLVAPLACGFGLVWVTSRLASRLFDARAGLAAGAVVAVAPSLVFLTTTGLYPDPPMVLCGALGLYWLLLWADEGRTRDWLRGACTVSLAILLKLTALYLGIPVLYLFARRYGPSWWRRPRTWLAAGIMLLPPALWYWHAYRLYLETGNTFGILAAGYSKFATRALLLDPHFHVTNLYRTAAYHLTFAGAVGFVWGCVRAWRERIAFALVWLGAVVLHSLVVANGVKAGHYQYLLPVLPVGALLAGAGLSALAERALAALRGRRERLAYGLVTGGFVLFAVSAAAAEHQFQVRDRAWEMHPWYQKKATGLRVKRLTPPDARLIVVDTQMDGQRPESSMVPPEVFYFSDRRGWYLSMAWLSEEKVERLHAQGASHLVVSGQSVDDFRRTQAALGAYLARAYTKLEDDDEGIVFAFTKPSF
jgi:4-amino-4-deoxy-L-arabinose transferase-like glycosyltransferase